MHGSLVAWVDGGATSYGVCAAIGGSLKWQFILKAIQLGGQLTTQNQPASTGGQLEGTPNEPYSFGPIAHWHMLWLQQPRSSPMPGPELIYEL